MNMSPTLVFGLLAAILSGAACQKGAAENTVDCGTLPEAVKRMAHPAIKHAIVRGCSVDKENGRPVYEISLIENGKNRDLTFDGSGKLIEAEQEIATSELPPSVAAAILKSSSNSRLLKVESLSREGRIVSYEASLRRHGKLLEVAFTPDGTSMKPE